MGPNPRSGPAPDVIGETDCRDWCHLGHRRPDEPPDEREPETTEAHTLRARGEHEVDELAAAMRKASEIAPGPAVLEGKIELLQRQPRPGGVDRHARLDAESGRSREAGRTSSGCEMPLPRERLPHRQRRRGRG